jgi:hypothetical protein
MAHKEPPPVAILSARLMRAYPSLSTYSAASLAVELCAIERAQHRHAERQCSGEDGGYVRFRVGPDGRREVREYATGCAAPVVEHDPEAEARAEARIGRALARWNVHVNEFASIKGEPGYVIELHGDPRGAVLKLRLPGEAEAVAV